MSPLFHFTHPVLVIGPAGIKPSLLTPLLRHYPVIAADGGADVAQRLGVAPRLIIGDFDSIKDTNNHPQSRLVHLTDQDSTDFEKVLQVVQAPLYLAFGFLGKRFDHSLASLHAMANAKYPVLLVGKHDALVFTQCQFTASLPAGCRLSVHPLTSQAFANSQGLVWDLAGLTLTPYTNLGAKPGAKFGKAKLGTSNQVITDQANPLAKQTVTITPKSDATSGGGYFVIIPAHHWRCLLETIELPD